VSPYSGELFVFVKDNSVFTARYELNFYMELSLGSVAF